MQAQRPHLKGDVRPIPKDATVIGREESAIVVGIGPDKNTDTKTVTTGTPENGTRTTATTTTTPSDEYKTQFVKVYQDAGVIGVSMLTLLVLCLVMGWFSMRVLRMYTAMVDSRDKAETARLEYFAKLTEAVTVLSSDVKQVMTDLRSDHNTQDNELANITTALKSLADKLDLFLFRRPEGGK